MSSDGPFLGAAAAIGHRIVREAVWDGGRCAWMGAVASASPPGRREQRALGPDLFAGTAGVGLYLAQLAAVTGEEEVRRSAFGALRHAVARASKLPAERRDGFHAGVLGIAWAAGEAGSLLHADELRELACETVRSANPPPSARRCPDLLTGAAGRIVALLALAASLDEPRLVEDAVADGEELLATARVTRHGRSWKDPRTPRSHELCGLSHGAAGIACALIELFALTADDRFSEAAAGAFSYERSWLDTRSGTWPDLHISGHHRDGPRRTRSPFAGTWSHGEAGILLSRLRAITALGATGPHVDDADVAMQTTRRLLAEALPHAIGDLSPCSGLVGLADALLCAAGQSADRWGGAAELATDLGRAALERYDPATGGWPCGVPDGITPSLFLGLSGIGWFFLRLYDSAINSPLQPHFPLTHCVTEA
jgi:lantibiotic modifying enzyme